MILHSKIILIYTDRGVLAPAGSSSLAGRFGGAGVPLLTSAVLQTFATLQMSHFCFDT